MNCVPTYMELKSSYTENKFTESYTMFEQPFLILRKAVLDYTTVLISANFQG